MRKIHLHGQLGDRFVKTIDLDVATAGEAIYALSVNFPDFEASIRAGSFHVVRGADIDNGMDLDAEECAVFKLGSADLHIVPVIAGSKRQGTLKIVLGVALVGAAVFFSGGAAAGLATQIGSTGLTYGNLAMGGLALALSGVSQMMTPESDSSESQQSFLLGGPGNFYAQGNPVPLVYGEAVVGSVLISAAIDIEQVGV